MSNLEKKFKKWKYTHTHHQNQTALFYKKNNYYKKKYGNNDPYASGLVYKCPIFMSIFV